MKIDDIVRSKGNQVHTIEPQATLFEVVQMLVRFNIGSLVVCESDKTSGDIQVIGIITERDILRTQATCRSSLESMTVGSVLSKSLVTASPKDSIENAVLLMTMHRIRHLPVMDGEKLCGLVSIGDIVKSHHDQLEVENHFMKSYIQGEGAEVATVQEN